MIILPVPRFDEGRSFATKDLLFGIRNIRNLEFPAA
jgi:hypothetical protein